MTTTVHIVHRDHSKQKPEHCAHRIFCIKWLFEDILDTFGDNKEVDFDFVSESVGNT